MKILISSLVFIFVNQVSAFTLISSNNSYLRGWDKKNLVLNLNSTNCPTNIRYLIEDSVAIWNSISSAQLQIELSANESAASVAQAVSGTATEEAVVVCDLNFGTTTSTDPNFVGGIGSAQLNSNNQIVKGFLILNVQTGTNGQIGNYSGTQAKILIAHEVGHVIGLGHSSDISALMYYTTGYKKEFTLSQDDKDGYTYLYPRDETGGDLFMGGCGLIKSKGHHFSYLEILILLFFLMLPFYLTQKLKIAKV